ncbi:hypothetical protein HWD35_10445 [Tsukamurella tyrosinosolvens]|nr:hypothetical protein [Tsukamurella tyrosinosolvens]
MGSRRSSVDLPPEIANPDWSKLLDQALSVEGSLGNVYRRFHNYSTSNCAFLLMQGCPIEPIATYQRWQQIGRQVIKGASAFYVQRPIMVKTGEVDEKTGEDRKIKRYKPVKSIFPVSMTEGEPLAEVDLPAWSSARALAALAIRQVAFEDFDGNKQGYSIGRDFAVNPAAKYPQKTMFHEIGHIALGHTVPDQLAEYARHRGVAEVQAEAVAHLSMTELGLMTPEMASVSRAYLQTWGGSKEVSDWHIRRVFQATDQILEAGREQEQLPG